MLRLILALILLLLSLLVLFRAPTSLLWYVSIVVTEFSWLFFALALVLLCWHFGEAKYNLPVMIACVVAMIVYALPVVGAYKISRRIEQDFTAAFTTHKQTQQSPFSLTKMITGAFAKQVAYSTFTYDSSNALTLDLHKSAQAGKRPCVISVHGGSWAGGDSRQLPELNSELAKRGYHVASINYRLAPTHIYPAPVEDIQTTIAWLKAHASELSIDSSNFILLGRSAGGQIVLSAAYTINDPSIKGVISFYGPTDMVWGYQNPTNPLVLDSRQVMRDYLGGSYEAAPMQYVNSSPTETVKQHAIPTLLLYGENDPLVSHLHGHRLNKSMAKTGVPHYELYLPWATHGFDWTLNGPGGQLSTWSVLRFIEAVTL